MSAPLIVVALTALLGASIASSALARDEEATTAPEASRDAPAEGPPDGSTGDEAPRPLDLRLRYDPLPAGEDAAWGAIRVTASIESTQLFLDGEPIGTGTALRDRVAPGLHVLEARLPSGRRVSSNLLVRPGALVESTLMFGDRQGEEAFSVLMNVLSIAATTIAGSAMATQGNTPIQTTIPGLIRAGAAMASGNRALPRP